MTNELPIYDLVKKLIGPVRPLGESHTDKTRYDNLKVLLALTESLIDDINNVASYETRHEYSMKKAGEKAKDFLMNELELYSQ